MRGRISDGLMKQMGLKGAMRGKAVRTTISDRAAPQGFVYMAFVFDAFARRNLG